MSKITKHHLSVTKLLIDSCADIYAQDNLSIICASGEGHLSKEFNIHFNNAPKKIEK